MRDQDHRRMVLLYVIYDTSVNSNLFAVNYSTSIIYVSTTAVPPCALYRTIGSARGPYIQTQSKQYRSQVGISVSTASSLWILWDTRHSPHTTRGESYVFRPPPPPDRNIWASGHTFHNLCQSQFTESPNQGCCAVSQKNLLSITHT